ncbi:hypothetical protein QQ045_005458 [Rhodiola kirilowii]
MSSQEDEYDRDMHPNISRDYEDDDAMDGGNGYAYGDGDDDGISLGCEEEEYEDEDYWHCEDEADDHVHLIVKKILMLVMDVKFDL